MPIFANNIIVTGKVESVSPSTEHLIKKVKVTPPVDPEKYHVVSDGDLVKHYNRKSSYLSDMASIEKE